MATYYRWRKYNVSTSTSLSSTTVSSIPLNSDGRIYLKKSNTVPNYNSNGFDCSSGFLSYNAPSMSGTSSYLFALGNSTHETYVYKISTSFSLKKNSSGTALIPNSSSGTSFTIVRYSVTNTTGAGSFIDYVYSISSSSYPNGGTSGSYYYSGRTTVTSPTAPSGLTYPSTLTPGYVTVSWTKATSNTSYAVSTHHVEYAINGGSTWTSAGSTSGTSLDVTIPGGARSIQFRVRARDTNGQYGSYVTGTLATVLYDMYAVGVNTIGINPAGAGMYEEGDTVTIYAGERDGYTFVNWTTDNNIILADPESPTTTFTMIADTVVVTAHFESNFGSSGGGQ